MIFCLVVRLSIFHLLLQSDDTRNVETGGVLGDRLAIGVFSDLDCN